MKSFAKAFRATLSIALALCMVMSFVTVSADGTQVTVTPVENSMERLADGYYSVQYTVGNITASADADATIMVYSGNSITKETIKYANQADATEGSKTFTMEVPAGVYNVVAGGTGATSNTATLTANTAPEFATTAYTVAIDTDDLAGTIIAENVVATDVDGGQTLTYTLEGSESFAYANGTITTTAVLAAGTYNLTLTASDGIATATATITVTVEQAIITAIITAYADVTGEVALNGSYNLPTEVDATVTNYTAETIKVPVTWDPKTIDTTTAGEKKATGTIALPTPDAGYEFVVKDGLDNKVTATITVKKAQVSGFNPIDDITVSYGTALADIEFPTEVESTDGYKFTVAEEDWTTNDYKANEEGTYKFTVTPASTDNYEVVTGAYATVNVIVQPKPVKTVTITGYTVTGVADDVKVGDKITLPTTVIANLSSDDYSAATREVNVTWTYNNETVKEITATAEGEYVFTGTVDVIANDETDKIVYTFTEEEGIAAPTLTVTATKTEVTIDHFETVADITGNTGTAFSGLGLPEEVRAYNAQNEEIAKFLVDWDKNTYNSALTTEQTITGTVNVVGTNEIDYVYAENVTNKISAKVTLTPQTFDITSLEEIGTIYVTQSTEYEELALALPKTIEAYYDGGFVNADVEWPKELDYEWFPPAEGNEVTIVGTITLPENYTNDSNLKASVVVKGIYEDFTFTTNGVDKDTVVVELDAPVVIDVDYNDITNSAKYMYAIGDDEKAELPEDGIITLPDEIGKDEIVKITIYVSVEKAGNAEFSKKVSVYVAGSMVSGNAYVNATKDDAKYSAMRINKQAGSFIVTNDFRDHNDIALTGTITYYLVPYGNDDLMSYENHVASNTTGVFDDIDECDGAYRVIVAYSVDGEDVHKAGRTIYITEKALWFSDMTINGKTGSGVVVRRDKDITHKFTLSDLGVNGKAYVGSELVSYQGDPTGSAALAETTTTDVENNLTVAEDVKGARTLYALAKLTEGQSYYDLKVGRTVYVKDTVTAVCNVLLNGSTHCAPTVEEGAKLVIKPYWAAGSIVEPSTKYTVQFAEYDEETKTWGEYGEAFDCAADGTYEINKSDLVWANRVKYTMYVNEDVDATIEKTFYIR